MIDLESRACCTQTGEGHVGTVVGKVKAEVWIGNRALTNFKLWNDLFPGWEHGYLIYLKLDEPERGLSYKEFKKQMLDQYGSVDEEKIMAYYDQAVGFIDFVACPEAGVELC